MLAPILLIFIWLGCASALSSLFACDSGNLTSTCILSGPHFISNQSFSISGNSLVISNSGSLYCSSIQCSIQVNMENEVTILGNIHAGQIQITSPLVSIGESGLLNVTGMGNGAGQGPGAGQNESIEIATGGSYGGYAMPKVNNMSQPYGSLWEPTDFGSGGGSSGNNTGGAGGGIILIQAGELVIYGKVLANGANGQGNSGGGSGGSIYCNASSIEGSGQLSVIGAGSTSTGLGSGGRIAIVNQNSTQPLQLELYAYGGISSLYIQAGAGTIYFAANDTLVVDNMLTNILNNIAYTGGTPIDGTYISAIVAKNLGIITPTAGTVNCSSLSLVTNAALACVNCYDTWSINALETIEIDSNSFLNFTGWCDISAPSITLNGTIYGSGLSLTAEVLTIYGTVNTDGGGLGPALGPGAGGSTLGSQPGGGAGHGNIGVPACYGPAAGGAMYDSDVLPSDYGSGGGNSGPLLGGTGGGIIVITATNLTLAGSLLADGSAGTSAYNSTFSFGAGGGSGGSISIQCEFFFAKTCTVQANGGDGGGSYYGVIDISGGGGAGGRVYFNFSRVEIFDEADITLSVSGGATQCISSTNQGTIVTQCSPGHYSDSLSFICQPCPAGLYSPNGGVCQFCPSGTSTNGLQGQENCTECLPGYYSPYAGNSNCSACSAGSYTNESGQTHCVYCPPGYSNDYEAQTNCTACPPGTMHGDSIFPTPCIPCPGGFYNNQSAQTQCSPCPSGYASTENYTSCVACGPGFFSEGFQCLRCYSGYYSNSTANVACDACPSGTYQPSYEVGSCSPCLPGTSSFAASSYCFACSAGTFNNISGGECNPCPPRTYQPNSGKTTCLHCEFPFADGEGCEFNSSSGDPDKSLFAIFVAVPLFLVAILVSAAFYYRFRTRRRQTYQRVEDPPPTPQIPPIPPPLPFSVNDSPSEPVEKECIICCDKPKSTVLLPCGHIASCEDCTRMLLATKPLCPCCRKTILSFVRV